MSERVGAHARVAESAPAGGQGSATLYIINLLSSTTPMTLEVPYSPELEGFAVFRSRRVEDGRDRFRLHLGYFESVQEAERAAGRGSRTLSRLPGLHWRRGTAWDRWTTPTSRSSSWFASSRAQGAATAGKNPPTPQCATYRSTDADLAVLAPAVKPNPVRATLVAPMAGAHPAVGGACRIAAAVARRGVEVARDGTRAASRPAPATYRDESRWPERDTRLSDVSRSAEVRGAAHLVD